MGDVAALATANVPSESEVLKDRNGTLDFIAQVPFRSCWDTGTTIYRSVENYPEDWQRVKDFNKALFGHVHLYRHLPSDTLIAIKVMGNDSSHTHGTLAMINKIKTGVLERLLVDEQGEHMVVEIGASYYLTYLCGDGAGKRFVLPMRGVWMDDSFLYFATEPCSDELFNVIKEECEKSPDRKLHIDVSQKSARRRRKWAYQIFSALSYLHHNNVAHRDISLENILIHADGTAKLMDFGLAVPADTPAYGSVGKGMYRAPETYKASAYCPKKADIFSCGMVLFILLTGRPIFKKATLEDSAFVFICTRGIEKLLQAWNLEYSDAFTLVTRCLCRKPADRAPVGDILMHPWFDSVREPGFVK